MEPDSAPRAEVVRSRERLRVGLERVPYERVVVRKVVVTEERTVTVVLRREELVVERFPLPDATGLVDVSDLGEHAPAGSRALEIVLHQEEADVVRRVVPRERVRVSTTDVEGETTVTADVRVEQVAAERLGDRVVRAAGSPDERVTGE